MQEMAKHNPTPNDQRSNAKNPTSSDHKAAMDNHGVQLNPNSGPYASSRQNSEKK